MKLGNWRYLQNVGVSSRRKLTFLHGFEKLLSASDYNNQDLHDPLFGHDRQPFNLLFQSVSTGGNKKLIAATTNRIYTLNNATGNWQILSDQLGVGLNGDCRDTPWGAAQVNNTVVFTNGTDSPVYYILDQPPNAGTTQSVSVIPDLARIGLSRAKLCCAFRGFLILADVVMDGERVSQRLVWSDKDRPLSFYPSPDLSAAGYQDLGYGQEILALAPIGDSLLIYTSTGIWEAFITGDEAGLGFKERFSDPTGSRMIAYPRTLVAVGDRHFYMGRDAIYEYSLYNPQPERIDYLYRIAATIFTDINRDECFVPVGGFDAIRKTVWFSWGRTGENCPSQSVAIQMEFGVTSFVDVGFTAFVNYGADTPLTVRDWIVDNCLCTLEELEALSFGFNSDNEGYYCVAPASVECANRPVNIISSKIKTIEDIEVEDWDATPDANSLCAILGEQTSVEVCGAEASCTSEQRFVAAATEDYALKQMTNVFTREYATVFSGCGAWRKDSYHAILRSGPVSFSDVAREHVLHKLELQSDVEGSEGTIPIDLRVGSAYQCADPNSDRCGLVWRNQARKSIGCASVKTGPQHLSVNTRPSDTLQWPLFIQGRFLYFEFTATVNGKNASFTELTLFHQEQRR